ncbi:MAG TPA: CBS domain-containing protein [Candidatus Dormibacteraeota bacterium]|jgi:CBS domain-containing protein|nr:CBS domain-containing protein [Candidatus Dormibacteraeota bacterium]
MHVRHAMSTSVLIVSPHHTVVEAAKVMLQRRVGAAIVLDPELAGPGILTERDVMRAVAEGVDCASTPVSEYMTYDARTASIGWDLDTAATEMCKGNFRHLIVVEGDQMVGVVSMRDIVGARVREAAGV